MSSSHQLYTTLFNSCTYSVSIIHTKTKFWMQGVFDTEIFFLLVMRQFKFYGSVLEEFFLKFDFELNFFANIFKLIGSMKILT